MIDTAGLSKHQLKKLRKGKGKPRRNTTTTTATTNAINVDSSSNVDVNDISPSSSPSPSSSSSSSTTLSSNSPVIISDLKDPYPIKIVARNADGSVCYDESYTDEQMTELLDSMMTAAEMAALLCTTDDNFGGRGARAAYRVQRTGVSRHHVTRKHNRQYQEGLLREQLAKREHLERLQLAAIAGDDDNNSSGDDDNQSPSSSSSIVDQPLDQMDETVLTTPSRFRAERVGDSRFVRVTDITLHFDERVLLDGANLLLSPGRRYGLVGPNGTGKSTLLRKIASGALQNFPAHLSVHYVQQEIIGSSRSALQCVIESHREREDLLRLERELQQLSERAGSNTRHHVMISERLDHVYRRLEEIDAANAEARAVAILRQFGFTELRMNRPTSELSGGWRMRVALAQVSFLRPDVLLLDEPTNHLDLHAVLWLQRYLREELDDESILVVVSHDRAFLDSVCTDTVILADRRLHYHQGNYSNYVSRSTEAAQKHQHMYEWQEKQRKHMEQTISNAKRHARDSKLGDRGNHAGVIRSREKAIERLGAQKQENGKRWKCSYNGDRQQVSALKPPKQVRFKLPDVPPLHYNGALLSFSNASFAYNADAKAALVASAATAAAAAAAAAAKSASTSSKRSATTAKSTPKPTAKSTASVATAPSSSSSTPRSFVLRNMTLSVSSTSRIAIVGANGCGKSTMMKLLHGEMEPHTGEVFRYSGLRVAHFTQHHVDRLDLALTPVEHLQSEFPHMDLSPLDARQHLGAFGIHGDEAVTPMRCLSGGQRSRVVLSTVTWELPHILLLDEPTNHLDMPSVEALAAAISKFGGAVVIVSHDQYLIDQCCEELWVLRRGSLTRFNGTFESYKESILVES